MKALAHLLSMSSSLAIMAGAEPDPEGGVSTLEERQACSANAPMLDGSEASFPVLSPEDNYYYGAC